MKTYLIHNGATKKGVALCERLLSEGNRVFCVDIQEHLQNAKLLMNRENFNFCPCPSETEIHINEKIDSVLVVQDDTHCDKIFVTKSFLPPLKDYVSYLSKIWNRGVLTNQGPCLTELEEKIRSYLGVDHFQYLSNGTLALQLALSCLEISQGEIITTPFSYVATTSSILWERCTPVFVDIETDYFTIDPDKIEEKITPQTKAIMAVHVFGYPCQVDKIQKIADKHNLKVIYDGAHAFGSRYKGRSVLSYGDVATLSFHATKLFHTVEGGGCVLNHATASKRLDLQKRFGHDKDEHFCLGINAKASEFHAAMGLANFTYLPEIIKQRCDISQMYDSFLSSKLQRPQYMQDLEYNYAYYPVVFDSEQALLSVFKALNKSNIFPRRYFYPALNTLPYVQRQSCPCAEDISSRVACLPLYVGLEKENIETVCKIILENC